MIANDPRRVRAPQDRPVKDPLQRAVQPAGIVPERRAPLVQFEHDEWNSGHLVSDICGREKLGAQPEARGYGEDHRLAAGSHCCRSRRLDDLREVQEATAASAAWEPGPPRAYQTVGCVE